MNDKLYKYFCILSDEIMKFFDYLLEKIEENKWFKRIIRGGINEKIYFWI